MEFGKEYIEFARNNLGIDFAHKGDWQKNYVNYILAVFPEMRDKKMLDHGFALGAQASAFVDAGVNLVGVEPNQWNVDHSPFENLKGKLFASPENKYSFAGDKSIDFIHSSQVMEHIPLDKLPLIVQEFKRVLSENGRIYISTCPPKADPNYKENDPTHISCFDYKFWDDMFEAAGFERDRSYEAAWANQPMFREYNWMQMVYKHSTVKKEVQTSTEKVPEVPVTSLPVVEPPTFKKRGRK